MRHGGSTGRRDVMQCLASADASRIGLIVRWGGRRCLSGFLPVQSVYADFYVVDALWPDFNSSSSTKRCAGTLARMSPSAGETREPHPPGPITSTRVPMGVI